MSALPPPAKTSILPWRKSNPVQADTKCSSLASQGVKSRSSWLQVSRIQPVPLVPRFGGPPVPRHMSACCVSSACRFPAAAAAASRLLSSAFLCLSAASLAACSWAAFNCATRCLSASATACRSAAFFASSRCFTSCNKLSTRLRSPSERWMEVLSFFLIPRSTSIARGSFLNAPSMSASIVSANWRSNRAEPISPAILCRSASAFSLLSFLASMTRKA